MTRLPKVNGDDGNWGDILNDYLSQSHTPDGTLSTNTVGAPQLKQNSVTSAAIAPGAITPAAITDGTIPTAKLSDLTQAVTAALPGNIATVVASEITTQIDPKVAAAQSAKTAAETAATNATAAKVAAETARDAALTATTTSDGVVADLITAPSSATATALAATYASSKIGPVPSDYAKLMPFFAALGGRAGARCTIAYQGDSISEGAYSSDVTLASTPGMLLQLLRARFPVAGVAGGRGWIPAAANVPAGPVIPVAIAGTVATLNAGFSPNNMIMPLSQVVHKATVSLTGTSFDLVYVTFSSAGIGYYKIDGGAAVTFNTYSSSTVEAVKLNVALAAGLHTIEVGWSSGGPVYFEGFIEYNQDETKGIHVARCAESGSSTKDWIASGVTWAAGIAKALNPGLIIMQFGTNDARIDYVNGKMSAAQYKTNLLTMIAAHRAAYANPPPIMLSLVFEPNLPLVEPWANYAAAAKSIADSDAAVVFIDHSARMPRGVATNTYGLYNGDKVHPNDKGYSMIADTTAAVIAPR